MDVIKIDSESQAKRDSNSYVLHCLAISKKNIAQTFATKYVIEIGFGSICNILNGQPDYD